MSSTPLSQNRQVSVQKTARTSLVVIDSAVANVSALVADITQAEKKADVLLLSSVHDGIAQITEALKGYSHLSSLHIVSHGTPGALRLGGVQLSFETLDRYAASLERWANLLQGKEILFYGCQLAKGAIGHLFVQQLHQLTGANIAASTARIGRVGDRTNWTLDAQFGTVNTPVAFSEQLQANYAGHFDPVVDFSVSTDTLIESEGTPFSFIFELSEPPPAGGTVVRFEADRPQAINQWDLFQISFSGLAGQPVDVSPNLDFSAFEVTIVEQNASISLPVFNDFIDDSPDAYTWTVSPVSGGTVGNSTAQVTIYDDASEVPVAPPPPPPPAAEPEVSISADVTTLVEDEGTEVTLTINLSEAPTDGAVLVNIDTGKPFALGDFDIFPPPPQASSTGGQLVRGNQDNSGFTFAITEQVATISLPVFDDPDRTENGAQTDPDGPLRNDDIGEEQTTFSISPGDGYTVSSNGSVTLTIKDSNAAPNTAPVADDDSYNTAFETALTVNAANGVLDGDTDADGDDLSAAIDAGPASGSVELNSNGSFTYTPNAGFSGDDSFTYTVDDGNGGTDSATVTVSVAEAPLPENTAPVAGDDSYSTAFDTALTVDAASGVLASDSDADGDPLTVAIDSAPANGTAELNADGSFTYTPNAGFSGDDSFTYTVDDGNGGTDSATVTVAVAAAPTPENTAPVAGDDAYEVILPGIPDVAPPENLVVDAAGGLLANDTDADGDALTVAIATQPDSGTVELNADGSFTYTPDGAFSDGSVSFTYTLDDGNGGTDTGEATINVISAPTPPPSGDPVVSFSTSTDSLNEAEGTPITFNFSVDGEIPADGLIVRTADNFFPNPQLDFNLLDFEDPDVIDGIEFFDFEETGPGQFVIDWKITQPEAFIKVAVFDDNIAEADTSFTTGLLPGEGYTLNPDATTVTVSVTDGVDGTGGPAVSVTADKAAVNEGDSLTITFNVDGDIPDGGLEVVVDSEAPGALGDFITTDDTGNPLLTFTGLSEAPVPNGDASGFIVNITENTATINLDIFDDGPGEGPETFDFQILNGENYDVDAQAGGFAVTLNDGPVSDPVVSFSVEPVTVSEADGPALVLNFSVDGDIPPEGLTVNLEGDTAEILQQFLAPDGDGAVQTRVSDDGVNVFYRFDTSFEPGAGIEGGTLDVFSLEDGDPDEGLSDPAAAGTGFLSNFSFTITEANASITLPVSDDIVQEEDQTFSYTLVNGDGYTVDPAQNSGTFTVSDGVVPATSPTVGVTASETTLIEDEQTRTTITFTTEGDIPAEGLLVQLKGSVRSIAEFDVNGTNNTQPRDPEGELVVTGPVVTGGNIAGTDEVAGSVFFRITEPTASIDVAVFDDDIEEGTENFSFSLVDGEGYEIDAAASSFDITIEDGEGTPPVNPPSTVIDNDSVSTNNDIIANAQTIELSADNPTIQVQAAISQRFEDRSNTVDGTEDVDMFKVELKAGDVITIDADSITTELDGFQVGPAPDITIFDANGEKAVVGTDEDGEDIFAFSSRDGAPDEAFVANRDAYLEFTAPADGTYYIGASQYRNNNYDANVVGSGSGALFSPRFGVGPGGEYTLDIKLNPTGFDGPIFEEFSGTPNEGAPVVSFTTDAGTFVRGEERQDIVISSEIIEDDDLGNGVLNVAFTVDGEIPEGGLEVLVKNEDGVDLNEYFEGLGGQPRIVVGGTLSGGLYDADGALVGFKALVTANNALFPFSVAADREDDPNAPETLTFSLANSPDYSASETAGSSEVTFYDSLAQVQASGGPVPTVGFTFDQTEFIESEGTVGTITVTVDGEIPEEGLQVYIDSEDRILGEFDVFNAQVTGGAFPSPNGTASGFFFRVFENTATITLSVFDETTNDQIPQEDALEGIEAFSLALQPLEAYAIDPNAASVDFTIKDNPDSVVLPEEGGEGEGEGEGESPLEPVDTDSRDTINDTLETAVETGLSADNGAIAIEGSIDVRWRNEDEQKTDNTEDVDLYSFNLAAGETVNISADSVPFELNGITQNTAATLRLFNAAGEELAISASVVEGGAVTEAAALEFTAPDAGTYYVGVSQYLNDNYDPMVNASGDGVQLIGEGISPGAYNLSLTLSDGGVTPPPATIEGTNRRDRLFGTDGNDTINALAGNDTVKSGAGDDIVDGGSGQDRLFGDAGDDTINGGAGNDSLFGGDGNDTIDGGAGSDRLFGNAGDDTMTGSNGQDSIFGGDGDDTIDGDTGGDRLFGDDGNDIITGGSGSDRLFGGAGQDIILGGGGRERMFGGADRDILIGGVGNDFLSGGEGDDVLMGVTGNDVLEGGSGADLFVFGDGDGNNVVKDFEVGSDKIALVSGELAFEDITITKRGSSALLGIAGRSKPLAILRNVEASALGEDSFTTVDEVSTVEDALTLLS